MFVLMDMINIPQVLSQHEMGRLFMLTTNLIILKKMT